MRTSLLITRIRVISPLRVRVDAAIAIVKPQRLHPNISRAPSTADVPVWCGSNLELERKYYTAPRFTVACGVTLPPVMLAQAGTYMQPGHLSVVGIIDSLSSILAINVVSSTRH